MNDKHRFEPDDQDLPEGWKPENAPDPQLETILQLARETDKTITPLPAAFEALRLSTRGELMREGLLRADGAPARAEESFLAWLKTVVFGGGIGAQTLRLGLTASVAFIAGANFFLGGGATVPTTRDNTPATISAPAPEIARVAPAPRETRTNAAAPEVREVASVIAPTPVSGVAIPRSVADQQDDAAGHEGWTSTAPGSSAWAYSGGGAASQLPVSAAPSRRVGLATDQRPDWASQAVDQLQMLKFYAMMNQDERSMPNIRGLEETLSRLMQEFEYNKEPKLNAIQIFRSADEAIAAQRYLQAIDSLDQVVRMAPGSSLAFLAQFQIGRIAYEKLDDYDMAMNAFAGCLNDYGTVSISADASRYIKNRLDLLTGTKADNWESLGAWKTALRATTAKDAVDSLLKVVEKTAFQELAGDAAIRLRDYAISDETQLDVDYESVRRVLQSRLASSTPNRHTARIQFALAEITLYRARDYDRAAQELRTAAAMNPDQDILRSIQLRLNQIGRRESRVPEKQ